MLASAVSLCNAVPPLASHCATHTMSPLNYRTHMPCDGCGRRRMEPGPRRPHKACRTSTLWATGLGSCPLSSFPPSNPVPTTHTRSSLGRPTVRGPTRSRSALGALNRLLFFFVSALLLACIVVLFVLLLHHSSHLLLHSNDLIRPGPNATHRYTTGITRIATYGDMGHSHYNNMGNMKADCQAGRIDAIVHMGK